MAQLEAVEVEGLPSSIESFVELRDRMADKPQGAAAAMVVALMVYAEDDELGKQCLAAAAHPERRQDGSGGYQGQTLRPSDWNLIKSQIGSSPHIPRSYVKGTAPERGYQLPASPYVFEFSDNLHSGDSQAGPYKVFIECSGADTPRPVTVARDDQGAWRAREWSTLIVGVEPPA